MLPGSVRAWRQWGVDELPAQVTGHRTAASYDGSGGLQQARAGWVSGR